MVSALNQLQIVVQPVQMDILLAKMEDVLKMLNLASNILMMENVGNAQLHLY